MTFKTNRRKFLATTLKAGAVGMGLPYFIPASVRGKAGNVAPSDRINIGCIGLGGQGTQNMRAFIQHADAQIVALCDVNKGSDNYDMLYQFKGSTTAGLEPARRRAVKFYQDQNRPVSYDDFSTYHDFRDLLARKDIDAVSVCTPDHWHGLISIAAAEAGKDIYCEKPLVNSIPEGRVLCNAVNRYGRILQTGSHERSNDSVRFACELVRNGRIGDLKEIYINMPNQDNHHITLLSDTTPKPAMPVPEGFDYDMWLGPAKWESYTRKRCHFWWRYILQYGGGEMTDRGAHIIDLGQFINNTDDSGPTEIWGKGQALKDPLFDSFIEYQFECTYPNGVRMIGGSEGKRGLKLVGTEGWIFIHIHGGRLEAHPKSLLKETMGPNEIHVGRSEGHHRDFLNAIKTRRKPIAHEEIGHRTASMCHLINIAMLTDKKLKWDPEKEQVTNNEEANRLATQRPMRSPWNLKPF